MLARSNPVRSADPLHRVCGRAKLHSPLTLFNRPRRVGHRLDRLKRLHAHKNELLSVLDRPEIPLHTNGSENDVRCLVTASQGLRRHPPGLGRDCRDGFLGLMKTELAREI